MFITFSRNFKNQRRAKRSLDKKKEIFVELRGTKTMEKVVDSASRKGFKKILILTNLVNGTATAQEINVSRHSPPTWRFGKERKMAIQ